MKILLGNQISENRALIKELRRPVFSRVFGENSPQVISKLSEEISANNYTSEQVSQIYGWNLGDSINIALSTGENIEMQIIGINHDDRSDGSGKAGLTLQMVNCLSTLYNLGKWNSNQYGYNRCQMREEYLPQIKSTLPSDWIDIIKPVNKKSADGGGLQYTETLDLQEDLFLLAEIEVFGTSTIAQAGSTEGTVYEYWKDKNASDRIKKYAASIGENPSIATQWSLRSCASNTTTWCSVNTTGNYGVISALDKYGVSFAFCV